MTLLPLDEARWRAAEEGRVDLWEYLTWYSIEHDVDLVDYPAVLQMAPEEIARSVATWRAKPRPSLQDVMSRFQATIARWMQASLDEGEGPSSNEAIASEVDELRGALTELVNVVRNYADAGPRGEEWQSDDLRDAIKRADAALARAEE